MELSNEDIVTNLLLKKEILTRLDLPIKSKANLNCYTNPNYDLSQFLKSKNNQIKKLNEKYLFVGLNI